MDATEPTGGGFRWTKERPASAYHRADQPVPFLQPPNVEAIMLNSTQNPAATPAQIAPALRGQRQQARRRLPPFGNRLDPENRSTIAVLTGSDAWTRGRSPARWFEGRRLLLPFGEDPTGYRWPVSGRECILYGFGNPEPRARLVALSIALVRAGAASVIWAGQWRLTVYKDGTSEARPADGALSEVPPPVFRRRASA